MHLRRTQHGHTMVLQVTGLCTVWYPEARMPCLRDLKIFPLFFYRK